MSLNLPFLVAPKKMKKLLLAILLSTLLLSCLSTLISAAPNDLLCAYCPELCGGHSGNPISSGERFYCQPGPAGSNTFTMCKNQPCTVYEKYAYDGQQLYLVEDISWATAVGPVRCSDSGQLAYYRTYGQGTAPMPWISRNMTQGDCLNRSGTVVGYEKGTNRQCPTPYSGATSGEMCLTYTGCLMLPNGIWTNDGLTLTVGGGAGAGENYYFDQNRGWIGFDRGSDVSGAFITDPIGDGAPPANCSKISQGAAYGACQAEQPFLGGPETKGASFAVKVASCFGPADPAEAVDALLRATKFDFPNNEQIANDLEGPLDNLKPANYNPQVSQRTALGKITYDVCEEGTTNWYTVEKEVEFKTPAWVEKMATEGKELASWLAPEGGRGPVLGEQTTNNSLAQAPGEVGTIPHGCKYFYADSYGNCDCLANGTCRGEHGCCPNHWWWGVCAWEDCQPQVRCSAGQLANACPGDFFGGPQPTPTPKICKKYTPQGGNISPEVVCVGGSCQVKNLPRSGLITEIVNGITQTICPGKTFLVTPKVQTPFVQSADTFLREQTFSIFKVSGAEAKEAFKFEHALENAQHEFSASPTTSPSETEIYGQRGVKDSYDWVQDALTPAGY